MARTIDAVAREEPFYPHTGFTGNFSTQPQNIEYATPDDRGLAAAYLNAMEQLALLKQQLEATQKNGSYKDLTGTLKSVLTKRLLEENKKLESLAMTDSLTGLPSRRNLMTNMIPNAYSRASRDESDIYFVMFDLDHFKALNDTYGHQAGDKILEIFGKYLIDHTREHERPARYGGEEFSMIANGNDYASFVSAVERLRKGASNYLTQTLKTMTGKDDATVTVSAGVASAKYSSIGKDGTVCEKEGLIGSADKALYRSKNMARNCTHVNYQGKIMHSLDFEASILLSPQTTYRR